MHLKGFEKMGITTEKDYDKIICMAEEITAAEINLDFPSVGATENIILAATLAKGTTIIINAAMEPEIVDLQNFLNRMGAKITGAGSNVIKIEGVKKLNNVSYNVMPDRIEAGTLLCSAAITGGNIILKKANVKDIAPVLDKLNESGCEIRLDVDSINLKAPKRLKAINIRTMPYPGFPTDMQSIIAANMCVSSGTSIIVENIFESRFKYTGELQKMGAKIRIEGNTAIIKGTRKLYASKIQATDLRGGASLVLAGLVAKGKTQIDNIEYILRGYEKLDEKLNFLGAKMELI